MDMTKQGESTQDAYKFKSDFPIINFVHIRYKKSNVFLFEHIDLFYAKMTKTRFLEYIFKQHVITNHDMYSLLIRLFLFQIPSLEEVFNYIKRSLAFALSKEINTTTYKGSYLLLFLTSFRTCASFNLNAYISIFILVLCHEICF